MTASAYPFAARVDNDTVPAPAAIAGELRLLAMLRAAGFPEAADGRLAALRAHTPRSETLEAAVDAVDERRAVDSWLAEHQVSAPCTLIPTASLGTDRRPRFVVAVPTDAGAAQLDAIERELSGDGSDAELRNFLDEILTDELAYIDFEPGVGFAALSAATAPVKATAVCIVTDTASETRALETAVESNVLEIPVHVVPNANGGTTVDTLARDFMSEAHDLVVNAGIAGNVPAVAAGALRAIHDGRVAAVTWRCAQRAGDPMTADAEFLHDIDNAGTVLAVLGFTHFALADAGDEVELVPLASVNRNSLVVSLSRTYLSRTGAV